MPETSQLRICGWRLTKELLNETAGMPAHILLPVNRYKQRKPNLLLYAQSKKHTVIVRVKSHHRKTSGVAESPFYIWNNILVTCHRVNLFKKFASGYLIGSLGNFAHLDNTYLGCVKINEASKAPTRPNGDMSQCGQVRFNRQKWVMCSGLAVDD